MMPRTLDSFYHRLLDDISEENLELVRTALNWLLFAARPLTLAELAEAVIIKTTSPCPDPEERFDDEDCLLEILPSGFIRYGGKDSRLEPSSERDGETQAEDSSEKKVVPARKIRSPVVQLSHHSVKDYLLSARVSSPVFTLSQPSGCLLLKDACMDYALHVVQASSMMRASINDLFDEYALLSYICGCWPYHFPERHDRVLIYYLVVNVFWNPKRISLSSTGRLGDLAFVEAKQMATPCSTSLPCEQYLRISGPKCVVFYPKFQDSLDSFNRLILPGKNP